jgi:hypothetical protein
VTHWVYRLSTFDFGTNLGYSLAGVFVVVVALVALVVVGGVTLVLVVAGVVTVTVADGGAADGVPEHAASSNAVRASTAENARLFMLSNPQFGSGPLRAPHEAKWGSSQRATIGGS